jgi:putative peptide zinc metalloprotease protein
MAVDDTTREAGHPAVSAGTRITLHPYTAVPDGDEFIVGRQALGDYFAIPRVGMDAIHLLEQGHALGDVADRLGQEYGERPDMPDFVEGLIACRLIATIDGHALEPEAGEHVGPPAGSPPSREQRLRASHVRWLVGRPAWALHGAALAASVALLALHPGLTPDSQGFRVVPSYALSLVIVLFSTLLAISIHELGHFVAARAVGLDGRFSIGRRLFRVVAQFHVGDVWRVGRAERLIVYAAGMVVNVWLFLAAIVLLIWLGPRLPTIATGWLRLWILLQWTTVAWQFQFYMKTDVYYIAGELFRARNLMDDAQALLRRVFARRLGEPTPLVVRAYALFYVLGVGWAVFLFATYVLPFVARALFAGVLTLARPRSATPEMLAEAALTVVLYSSNIGLLAWLWWRDSGRRLAARLWRAVRRAAPTPTLPQPTPGNPHPTTAISRGPRERGEGALVLGPVRAGRRSSRGASGAGPAGWPPAPRAPPASS